MKMKDVSILLSCFNGSDLIEQYIESICKNEIISCCTLIAVNFPFSHKDPEFVESQLARFPDLILVNKSENISLYEAWNLAASLATTEFVSNLNLDDRVTPDYYEEGVKLLNIHQADVFSSAAVMTSIIGECTSDSMPQLHFPAERFAHTDIIEYGLSDLLFEHDGVLRKRNIPHCAPIWRKRLHTEIGWFDSARFDFCADYAFWLRAGAAGKKFIFLKEQKTIFYAAPGTASDRLLHPTSQSIIDEWSPTFPPVGYRESHLGRNHDLLHYCMNMNAILSSSSFIALLDNVVTVVVVAHERPDLLTECIRTIRHQSYSAIDCVVILDNDAEGLLSKAAREVISNDARFRIVSMSSKIERNYARNIGIEMALGKWICFVDGDDRLPRESIQARVKESKKNPKSIIFGGLRVISDDAVLSEQAFSSQYAYKDLRLGWPLHCSLLVPVEKLKSVRYPASAQDLVSPPWLIAGEDVGFMIKLLKENRGESFKNCGDIVYEYRRHPSSSYLKRFLSMERVIDLIVSEYGLPTDDDTRYANSLSQRSVSYVFWWAAATTREGNQAVSRSCPPSDFILSLLKKLTAKQLSDTFNSFRADLELIDPQSTPHQLEIATLAADAFNRTANEPTLISSWLSKVRSELVSLSIHHATSTNSSDNSLKSAAGGQSSVPHQLHPDSTADLISVVRRLQEVETQCKPKIALVMGNGPSAKLIDFNLLCRDRIATVGMNAAYRFWDEINFRPTHYICMDTVVILSHAEEIYRLICEGIIERFFLRDEIKDVYPDLAKNERIFWYSDAVKNHDIFKTSYVTTGSWAIRWMAFEEKRIVATVGIDANYMELLPECRSIGDNGDLRLEIAETPKFNPNYFFSGYQQAGDKYNVPNDPSYLKSRGGLVHIDALKAVARDLEWLEAGCQVLDLSPISAHGAFGKMPLSDFFGRIGVRIVTSFREEKDCPASRTNVELALFNITNPFVASVIILFEGRWQRFVDGLPLTLQSSVRNSIISERLRIIEISHRPNYWELFSVANDSQRGTNSVQNSDIYLPRNTAEQLIIEGFSKDRRFYALTRWNLTENGTFLQGNSAAPPWLEKTYSQYTRQEKNYFSFDSYIFDHLHSIPTETKRILLGSYGCDTALSAVFKASGFNVSNPCLLYETIHVDEKPRTYDGEVGRKDLLSNVESFESAVKAKCAHKNAIYGSLRALSSLRRDVAWIGHRGAINPWQAIYRAFGATSWTSNPAPKGLVFKKISLSHKSLREGKLGFDISALTQQLETSDVFLEWELSGFDKPAHIVDILNESPVGKSLAEFLRNYPWMTMIHLDIATIEERSCIFDATLIIRECLAKTTDPEIYFHSNERTHDFTEGSVRTNGKTSSVAPQFIFKEIGSENHLAIPFSGIVRPGSKVKATINVLVKDPVRIRIDLCRDGGTSYEGTKREVLLSSTDQTIEIEHSFNLKHSGVRVQISCIDHPCTISGIKVSLTCANQINQIARDRVGNTLPVNSLVLKVLSDDKTFNSSPHPSKVDSSKIGDNLTLKKYNNHGEKNTSEFVGNTYGGARFVKILGTSGFSSIGNSNWQFKRTNGGPSYLMCIAEVVNTAIRSFIGGFRLKANVDTHIRVSLARHGDSSYEGGTRELEIKEGASVDVALEKTFQGIYRSLKLQIEILEPTDSCILNISGIFLNESAHGVFNRLNNAEISLPTANRLFRNSDIIGSCAYYLKLSELSELSVYRENLFESARKLGWKDAESVPAIRKRLVVI